VSGIETTLRVVSPMRLQLSLEASALKNTSGRMSRRVADPYAEIYLGDNEELVGTTEIVHANLNPRWCSPIFLEFDPNHELWIKVRLHDDVSGRSVEIDMGSVLVHVNAIYRASQEGKAHEVPLEDGAGSLILWAHESYDLASFFNFKFRGLHIKNIEIGRLGLGSTDPFYEIYKKHPLSTGGTRWQLIHRSDTIKNHLNPMWEEEELNMETFCDNELDKFIKIELWDYQTNGKHRCMGEVETTASDIVTRKTMRGNGDKTRSLMFQRKFKPQGVDGDDNLGVGDLIVLHAQIK